VEGAEIKGCASIELGGFLLIQKILDSAKNNCGRAGFLRADQMYASALLVVGINALSHVYDYGYGLSA
jgi:hypothetical protein